MTTLRSPDSAPSVAPDLLAAIAAWDQAAWSLAALALVAAGDGSAEITAAAQQLLGACGVTAAPGQPVPAGDTTTAQQIASQAAAPLHQAAAVASGRVVSWSAQSDEALLAQGQGSAYGAGPLRSWCCPRWGTWPAAWLRPVPACSTPERAWPRWPSPSGAGPGRADCPRALAAPGPRAGCAPWR